ncbi:MAG TPA: enoyl-CoA hydratase-related protein, partial [Advenella sp.]|nr:enoyl-CoA hydratase-related protein [Advenella sp.]
IVIAADTLVFVCPEIAFNMYPGVVQAALEMKTGPARARQLCLSGEALPVGEAKQLGLVTDVFADDEFEAAAEQRLAYFAARSEALLMARKAWLLSVPADSLMRKIGMLEPLLHQNFSHAGVQETIKSYLARLRTKATG